MSTLAARRTSRQYPTAYRVCDLSSTILAKADVAKIEALKSAKGTFTQAGQFQVIIGNTVSDFYNDFIAVSGINTCVFYTGVINYKSFSMCSFFIP